jgi:hypothetical protein
VMNVRKICILIKKLIFVSVKMECITNRMFRNVFYVLKHARNVWLRNIVPDVRVIDI